MKQITLDDLQTIVREIQSGDFSRIYIRALFIILRNDPSASKIIKELGDFVAHVDERTKGILYDHVDGFMTQFVDFAQSKTMSVSSPDILFSQEQVASVLIDVLKNNDVSDLDERMFRAQTFNIMYKILEIISDTKINNVKVENCKFSDIEKLSDGSYVVYFFFGPIRGILLNVGGGVKTPALIAKPN